MLSRFARLSCCWFLGLGWCALLAAEELPQTAAGASAFSSSQQMWLAEHPVIRVLSDGASPPFDFLDENGRHVGLYADYLDELSRATGLRFEWSEQNRRDQLVAAGKPRKRR